MAGGSSGGHLYPGVAVAHELRRLAGIDTCFLCQGTALEAQILDTHRFRHIDDASFALRPASRAVRAWRVLRGLFAAERPLAVIGLGGRASVAPGLAAAARGLPLLLLEQNRVLGQANRWLLRFARRVFVAFDDTRGSRRLRRVSLALGCPVRAEFQASELIPGSDQLLVLGGSQGAEQLNQLMLAAVPALPVRLRDRMTVIHFTGADKGGEVAAAYRAASVRAEVREYGEDLAACLRRASLVVARGGGSTIAELCAVGRGALLLPYPHHKDRHQYWNADRLVTAGAAHTAGDSAEAFTELLCKCFSDLRIRADLAGAARKLGKPSAARHIAQVVLTHLERLPVSASAVVPPAFARADSDVR
jgi:UDP-N-acetylglucosamine--N-acetylmuramyl-(pentapeptide) pyrophosphoryl-undecaprenol N-acetylglucosamine transferase